MKEVHLSEEAMHLKLFNRMLKEIKQFTEMRTKKQPLFSQLNKGCYISKIIY